MSKKHSKTSKFAKKILFLFVLFELAKYFVVILYSFNFSFCTLSGFNCFEYHCAHICECFFVVLVGVVAENKEKEKFCH